MDDLNIPLFRAEVKDSKFHRKDIEKFTELIDGKRYAIGLLCTKSRQIEVTKGDTTSFININNSTLAIHFPGILDSQGNKIFASLSKNGKGGDFLNRNGIIFKTIYKSVNGRLEAYEVDGLHHILAHKFNQVKIAGVKK